MEPGSPQVVGRYAIYGKIASGGMASVHFGRLIGGAGFSRTVAIKKLHPHLAEDPEFLSTMIDEARLAARIHHPNVVPTLDVVSTDGELLLVMEYVRGEALSRLVKVEASRNRLVPLSITSAIVLGALHGLHAAHEATSDRGERLNIVHRDVSPQNILVGVDGLARVIDFGIAKAAGRLQMTREGTVKGKIAYMSPEQLGGADVTRAADIYAMGVVLWEALTGKRLFQADSDAALAVMVVGGANEPPSAHVGGIPPSLDALVMKALARTPQRRFETAREMAELLTRIVPPALPTDVGEWCADAAFESLEKRGLMLSEIESSSGTAAVLPSGPELGSKPNRVGTGSASSRVFVGGSDVAAPPGEALTRAERPGRGSNPGESGSSRAVVKPRVRAMAMLADGSSEDELATLASRPSNLSMASYASPDHPSWWSKPQLVGALGGGILLGLVVAVAVWFTGRPPAAALRPVSAAPAPSQVASVAPGAAASSAPSSATPAPVWTALASSVGALPPAPPVASPTPPTRARSGGGRTPSRGSMTFEPPETAPTRPSEPVEKPPPPPVAKEGAPNCNPSFTIDADGTKHFKPECFAH
jgi:serine/threonine-protein kinase